MMTKEQISFLPPGDPRISAISSDDRFAAIAGWNLGGVSIWDVAHGKRLVELAAGKYGVAKFSPDGKWLATSPNGVQIWHTSDWTLAHELHAQGTTPNGLGIAFSNDSRLLAIGEPNGEVRLVDPRSGRDLARIMHPVPQSSAQICFTSDHRHLIALPADGQSLGRIWNLTELRAALKRYKLDWPADVLAPQPTAAPENVRTEVEWVGGGPLASSLAGQE
jgi:WD40 repeat protein